MKKENIVEKDMSADECVGVDATKNGTAGGGVPLHPKAEAPASAEQKAVAMMQVTVDVPKDLHDFAKGMGDLFAAIKGSLADGFQAGQDLPLIISEVIARLGPVVKNAQGVLPALKEHPLASGAVIALSLEKALK